MIAGLALVALVTIALVVGDVIIRCKREDAREHEREVKREAWRREDREAMARFVEEERQ